MTSPALPETLPILFTGPADGTLAEQRIEFEPLGSDGRVGAMIHRLYTPEESGGPAAAIVRYLPGAQAQMHEHPSFELIHVLSGEMEDESGGVYGPGSVLVLRPGSRHAPRSPQGCLALAVWEQPVRPV